jgi:patatin-like phospholipase/acyl hydrolase
MDIAFCCSIDGGGVRGLSTVCILIGIIDRLTQEVNNDAPLKLCEVFDLIGGTSTGECMSLAP